MLHFNQRSVKVHQNNRVGESYNECPMVLVKVVSEVLDPMQRGFDFI